MLLTIDKRRGFVKPENKLERLYLAKYLENLKDVIINNTFTQKNFEIIRDLLDSSKAFYEGNFINFKYLDSNQVFPLVNKSLTTNQILQYSFIENIDILLGSIDIINEISDSDKENLIAFISNLINNLEEDNSDLPRNYFEW